MSKRFFCPLLWLLATALALSAQIKEGRPAAGSAALPASEEILKETSEIRGLRVIRPVISGLKGREEIQQLVISRLNERNTPAELYAAEMFLHQLGLVPKEFKLQQSLIDLLTEQIAGYYDPRSREFYLANWIDKQGQTPVMVHELAHALQDQHFNLRRFEKWPKGDSDAELAAQSLIEGDATLVMMQFLSRDHERQVDLMKSVLSNTTTGRLQQTPRVIRDTLLFPYEKGTQWAVAIHSRGGWNAVSKAFKNLPRSTEQILHVEKYLTDEKPVKVKVPDQSRLIGKDWRLLDMDINGEWGYFLILDEYLKDERLSSEASNGWAGDRYALYKNSKTNKTSLVQKTVWDTVKDAEEFYRGYVARTEVRYGKQEKQEGRYILSRPDVEIVVEQSGSTVLILEGIPIKNSQKIMENLKRN
jgi:hypothetical protein